MRPRASRSSKRGTPEASPLRRRALLDHGVVFFRDQPLSPEQHLRFARRFGEVKIPVFDNTSSETPGFTVIEVSKPRNSAPTPGTPTAPSCRSRRWARSCAPRSSPPAAATRSGPACRPPTTRSTPTFARLDGMVAEHSTKKGMVLKTLDSAYARETKVEPPALHPVVRVHPETGRKCLYVIGNWADRIVGLSDAESEDLLHFLYEHLADRNFKPPSPHHR